MNIHRMQEEEYYAYLNQPHNPPGAATSDDAFEEEYYELFRKVEAVLSEFGRNDPYGEGDFTLEPHVAQSRGLGLEITNGSIITEALLCRMQALLSGDTERWEIYFGSSEYDFGIFIGPTSIRVFRMHENLLPQLDRFLTKEPNKTGEGTA